MDARPLHYAFRYEHGQRIITITSIQQGVALTGRNTTGPPRAAPGELRCICAALQTTDADRRHRPLLVCPYTMCRRASNNTIWQEAAANAFVRRERWAGTFACGRYLTMSRNMSPDPVKSLPSRDGIWTSI